MAASTNKIDLSLDDIIKLNKKTRQQQQKQAAGGRGKKKAAAGGAGRGKGSKGKTQQDTPVPNKNPTGGQKGKSPAGQRQRVQRLKQKAKKTLQKSQKPQATPSKPITGVKLRLGTPGKIGRGRGHGLRTTPGSASGSSVNVNRPGSRLQALRSLKADRMALRGKARRGGGAAGREMLKQAVAVGRGSARGKRKPRLSSLSLGGGGQSVTPGSSETFQTPLTTTPGGRGRGRGSKQILAPISPGGPRGGMRRGRGRGLRGRALRGGGGGGTSSTSLGQQSRPQSISIVTPSQFEPVGVDIPMTLCAEQHTSKSLHNRFTPQNEQRPAQRLVQHGGRTVNLHG